MLELVRTPGVVGDDRNHTLAIAVHQWRRFIGVVDDAPTELAAFCRGRIQVAQAMTAEAHARLLREAEDLPRFTSVHMLVNHSIDPAVLARYPHDRWVYADNGRVTDKEVTTLRVLYIDIDPERPKGISATDAEKRAAWEVCCRVEAWLASRIPAGAIGRGDSGNGYSLFVALEPLAPTADTTARVARFLRLVAQKFNSERVKIDTAVSNPARLGPAFGVRKCKGEDAADRPHRQTYFSARGDVVRVALEVLA